MIYARNDFDVPAGSPGTYSFGATFTLDPERTASKLTVRVREFDVILEVSETQPPVFTGDIDAEIKLRKGFESRTFVTPITGFRFRGDGGIANIDFTAYG